MCRTLYVTDLDGTLLGRDDRISAESLAILNGLVERGMCFTYATARSLSSARIVAQGLRTDLPVIVYNGAFIVRADTGEALAREDFSPEERHFVRDLLNAHDVFPMVYAYVDGVERVTHRAGKGNAGVQRYLDSRVGDKRFRCVDSEEEHYRGDIFYYTCIGELEDLQPVYDAVKDDPRFRCTLQQELYREEYWCEIMPARASKAHAIRKLKEMLGCERVVSFGDAVNDAPMFALSDECYAVANAVDALKSMASGVIESNEQNGVAHWLREHTRF